MEDAGLRGNGGKGMCPVSPKIDRVGEDQARVSPDAALRKQVLDSSLTLVFHPVVDRHAGRLRLVGKVKLGQPRAVMGLCRVDERGVKCKAFGVRPFCSNSNRLTAFSRKPIL